MSACRTACTPTNIPACVLACRTVCVPFGAVITSAAGFKAEQQCPPFLVCTFHTEWWSRLILNVINTCLPSGWRRVLLELKGWKVEKLITLGRFQWATVGQWEGKFTNGCRQNKEWDQTMFISLKEIPYFIYWHIFYQWQFRWLELFKSYFARRLWWK